MSQPNCEIVNTSNQTKSPSQRVWEVDFLRGFLILFVIFDHMMFNLWYFCQDASTAMFSWLCSVANAYYNQQTTLGALQYATHNGFVMAFVFVAGISSNLSASNLKRAIRLSAVALLLTAVTSALSQIVYLPLEINFNVIHVLAICCFAYYFVQLLQARLSVKAAKAVDVLLLVIFVLLAVVGYYFMARPLQDGGALVVLVNCGNSTKFSPADYLPLLPALSYFVVGALTGKVLYADKQSLLGSQPRFVKPITWCGARSLYVYLASQVAMFTFFYVFTQLLPIL